MWLSRGICNYRLENLKLSETCLKRAEKEGCKDRAANIYLKVSSITVDLPYGDFSTESSGETLS